MMEFKVKWKVTDSTNISKTCINPARVAGLMSIQRHFPKTERRSRSWVHTVHTQSIGQSIEAMWWLGSSEEGRFPYLTIKSYLLGQNNV